MKNSARAPELFLPTTPALLHHCRFKRMLLNVFNTMLWSVKCFLPKLNAGKLPGNTFYYNKILSTTPTSWLAILKSVFLFLFLYLSAQSHTPTVQQTPKSISALALLRRFNFGLFTPITLTTRKAILSALLLATDTNFQHSRLIQIKKLGLNGTQCGAENRESRTNNIKSESLLLAFIAGCSAAQRHHELHRMPPATKVFIITSWICKPDAALGSANCR